jgi:hypothetical protein
MRQLTAAAALKSGAFLAHKIIFIAMMYPVGAMSSSRKIVAQS